MADEAPNTPPPLAPAELPSPDQAGVAASLTATQALQAVINQNVLDTLDIQDPFKSTSSQTPESPVVAPEPKLPPGTSIETFPQELLQRAQEAGLSVAEAKAYQDPAHLERTLDLFDRQFYRQDPPAVAPPVAPPPPEPVPGLDADKFDPDLVTAWQAHANTLARQQQKIEQLEALLTQTHQATQQRQQQEMIGQIDRLFASDESMREVFGTAQRHELVEGSPEYRARETLLREMDALESGYRATQRPVPPIDVLYERAKRLVHGDRAQQRQIEAKLRNHQGQFIAKPTSRTASPEPNGDDKALRNLTQRLKGMYAE